MAIPLNLFCDVEHSKGKIQLREMVLTVLGAPVLKIDWKVFDPTRHMPLFLVVFGIGGTLLWPMAGVFFNNAIGGVESTLGSALPELREVERTFDDALAQLESLRESVRGSAESFDTLTATLSESSLSLATAAASVDKMSDVFTRASGIWALRLISEDFVRTLEETGKGLKDLSQTMRDLDFQRLVSEMTSLKSILHAGTRTIDFLVKTFKMFTAIVKTIVTRVTLAMESLQTTKYMAILLALDGALVHLSLAAIGLALRRSH